MAKTVPLKPILKHTLGAYHSNILGRTPGFEVGGRGFGFRRKLAIIPVEIEQWMRLFIVEPASDYAANKQYMIGHRNSVFNYTDEIAQCFTQNRHSRSLIRTVRDAIKMMLRQSKFLSVCLVRVTQQV